MEIRPHPYKFRQDIEIEVIEAQYSYKKKDFDKFEKSVAKLNKFLAPLLEKWTQVKEIEYNPKDNEDEESVQFQDFGRTYYYLSWIQHIETTEGYKGLSIEEWSKLIDHVFRERILAYKKRGSKSSFLGYLYRWLYFYILSAYRKIKVAHKPILAAFNNEDTQNQFLRTIERLPNIQRRTFEEYYFNNLKYKEIAEKYGVSESTVRNNKNKAINNIKKIESAIYIELKRKFRRSKGTFLK